MERIVYRIIAESIFVLHALSILIIAFGWAIPTLFSLHIVLLFGGLFLQIVLGNCFLSRWEFWFRKKVDPSISYDSAYINHYLRLIFGDSLRPQFMRVAVPTTFALLALIQATPFIFQLLRNA